MRHALAATVVACLFSVCPHVAAAAKVAPCAGGRFLSDVALLGRGQPPVTDAIVIDGSRQLSVGSCGPAVARLKGSPKGTLVKSTLRCDGVRGKVKLKARFDADCSRLAGVLKVGKQKSAFSAPRSTGCGDSLVDPGLGEQCEAPGECPPGQTCAACGCALPPTTSTISLTTTTTTSTIAVVDMMTPEERGASMDAVDARLAELPGIDVVADNEALASFMSSRPEFVDAGTSDHGLTAWGEWRDGVQYLIVRNREPEAATTPAAVSEVMTAPPRSAAARATTPWTMPGLQPAADAFNPETGLPSNMPASNQVRLLSSMGPGFGDVRPTLRQYLVQGQQYNEIAAAATVTGLKAVGGDGIFYMSAHGGNGKGTYPYAVYTATKWSLDNDLLFVNDLAAGRLFIMKACFNGNIPCDPDEHPEAYERHYAFTGQFVHEYWGDFADRSLIFLDFCSSNSTISKSLVDALLAKRAGVILGWDGDVRDADAGATALFVFDRLVGANDFRPEKPLTGFKQRPFDWISALSDCNNHGVCASQVDGVTATLVATEPNPGCRNNLDVCKVAFGLLAPSIRQMYVFESAIRNVAPDQLYIVGLFGQDQGSGRFHSLRGVAIDGVDVPILVWSPNLIAVELPHTGAGSSGDVIVRIRNHESNVAYLTEWEVPFTFQLDDFQSLRQTVTVRARFRADVRRSVRTIHQAPDEPQPSDLGKNHTLRDDTTASPVCAGTATIVGNDGPETETWSALEAIPFRELARFSPVQVATSQLILAGVAGWNADCRTDLTVGGVTAPGLVALITPQEIRPPPDGSFAGKVDLNLDPAGTVLEGAVAAPTPFPSRSVLNQGGNAMAVWRWPLTLPLPGTAPDANAAR